MDVERRSLLKGLAAGLTGAAITPTPSDARAGAASGAGADLQQAGAPPAASPGLLDAHQRATLSSLADLILPGAVAAGVIDRIDRVAAVDAPVAQRRLLNAIGRFDQEARAASGGRWLDLSDSAKLAILTRAAEDAPGQRPPPPWTRGQPVLPPATPAPPTTLRDVLDVLKTTIGAAYATTEAGMTALGWAGRASWRELPGCQAPETAKE